ncbi:anthranilate synthase component II [Helicobacter anatolicus]|uniref:anthranilate synthase component II n=1 Tax=Helicobacter anatolicus TaxID=2905874 RepID=UPI001E4AC0BA|nr:aminodeoxychorismate/anthranilate synthase component II [Helicobacter anatolicus]MCE3039188.1 aminodeoxychorismate/anthranilate synthase component II [Helicobacter anatolicus]
MIALIDHYDSFTYNIVHYLKDFDIQVFLPHEVMIKDLDSYSHIILSPGYGHPKDCKIALEILKHYHQKKKILGICLGHQIIALYFGSKILKLKHPCHGKEEKITHYQGRLFKNIKGDLAVGRYHSLYVAKLGRSLMANCYSQDGVLMAFEHESLPIFGLQFHPESVLSNYGKEFLLNFLSL